MMSLNQTQNLARSGTCAGFGRATISRLFAQAVALIALTAAVAGVALGQQDPAAPAEGILLNFEDAPLGAVLEHLSEAAGLVVVKEVTVEGRVSVLSKQPLSMEETVALLNTVLTQQGYAAIRMGRTLKIVTLDEAKRRNIPVRAGNDPKKIVPNDEMITQIIPIQYVDAVKLKDDLAPLIPSYAQLSANASSNALILTDTGANIRRIVEIVNAVDTHLATLTEIRVFSLQYADATDTARLINEVFKQDEQETQARRTVGGGMSRLFRRRGGAAEEPQEEGARSQKVVAAADERTNTVVVSAPPDILAVVENVIRDLDANPAQQEAILVYNLKNAQAENLETVLNELFAESGESQARTTGRGTTQRGRTGGRGGFLRMMQQRLSQGTTQAVAGLAGQVRVVADEDTNSLLIMTAPQNFDRIRAILSELDRPIPQVLIKVLIAEVTHAGSVDLGVEFSILNLQADGDGSELFTDFGVAAATGGLVYKLTSGDVTAALRALEEVGKLEVLSRPYILASDNQPATITVGEEVPFVRNTRTTETGQVLNTIEYEDIGIILNVTPHINPDGLVIMDISPEISTTTGTTVPISETLDAEVFAKRSAVTRVAIRDGQTIVIGGLIEDQKTESVRKVPLLGDIPLLGALFRRTVEEKSKTELLIFLTPHVAPQPRHLRAMSEDEIEHTKALPDAVEPGAFEEHMEGMAAGAGPGAEEAE